MGPVHLKISRKLLLDLAFALSLALLAVQAIVIKSRFWAFAVILASILFVVDKTLKRRSRTAETT